MKKYIKKIYLESSRDFNSFIYLYKRTREFNTATVLSIPGITRNLQEYMRHLLRKSPNCGKSQFNWGFSKHWHCAGKRGDSNMLSFIN